MVKVFVLITGLLLSAPGLTDYRVGVSVVDLTPSMATIERETLFLGGYGLWKDRGHALGVHDPVTARAVYLGTGDEALVILMIDSVGIPGPLAQRIARLASEKSTLDESRILVGATHSHTAPDLMGLWGGTEDRYVEKVVQQAVDAVVAAAESSRPARLVYASGKGEANNRRDWDFTDDELVVLQAIDIETGTPIVTLVNFAAHPVTISSSQRLVSSDYIHYLRLHAEEKIAAPVVYINGAIGDASPRRKGKGDDAYDSARRYGNEIAELALALLAQVQPVGAGMSFERREFTADVDNWVLSLAYSLGLLNANMSGMPWDRKVTNSVTYFSLGQELQAFTVPGEALTRMALPIKARMTAPAKLFLGLNGGCLGYFVPADEWDSGRNDAYEESVSIGMGVAAQLGDLAAQMIGEGYATERVMQ